MFRAGVSVGDYAGVFAGLAALPATGLPAAFAALPTKGFPAGHAELNTRGPYARLATSLAPMNAAKYAAVFSVSLKTGLSAVLSPIPAAVNTARSSVGHFAVLAEELDAVLTPGVDVVPVAGVAAMLTGACHGQSYFFLWHTASDAVELAVRVATVFVPRFAAANDVG